MENSILYASATCLTNQLLHGEISCAILINEYYYRIKDHNSTLNANWYSDCRATSFRKRADPFWEVGGGYRI